MRRLIIALALVLAPDYAFGADGGAFDGMRIGRTTANGADLAGGATGVNPSITANGTDGSVGLDINTKGGGAFRVNGVPVTPIPIPVPVSQGGTGSTSLIGAGIVPAISTGADIATSGASPYLGNDIIPMLHSQRLRTEQYPNICFTGTSTGQYQGTGLIPQATTQGLIWQTLLAANPTKNMTRLDRAIGGSTLGQLAGANVVASGSRPSWWSGSTGFEWPANIQAANCTQLYIMEAENNAGLMDDTSLRSFLATVATWTNRPDLFIVPNRMPGPGFGTGNPADYVRPWSYMRTLSKAGLATIGLPGLSLGLVDVGRWQQINQYGVDYATQTITTVINSSSPVTPTLTALAGCPTCGQYVSSSTNIGGDSYYDIRFAAGADIFANPAAGITFGMGAQEDQLIFVVTGGRIYGNFYHTTGFATGGSAPYSPGANMAIVVALQGGHITAFYNGYYILDQLVPHYQGSFTPNIIVNNVPTSPPMVIYNLGIGTPRQYRPTISDATYYGSSGTNYLIGGGGDVHPSDAGMAVDSVAVHGLNFSAAASAPPPISLTLTGDYSVPLASSSRQSFDPNGANRIVSMPAITGSNTSVEFTIHNSATSGSFVLTVNSALGGTIGTLANGATIRLGVKLDGSWMVL